VLVNDLGMDCSVNYTVRSQGSGGTSNALSAEFEAILNDHPDVRFTAFLDRSRAIPHVGSGAAFPMGQWLVDQDARSPVDTGEHL
jgi:hypothetical protein